MKVPRGELSKYVTVEEAAAREGVSASTIWRRIKAGELRKFTHLGRTLVAISDVDRMTEGQP